MKFTLLRLVDSIMTIPLTVIAIAVAGVFGSGEQQALIAIGIAFAPASFGLPRSHALTVEELVRRDGRTAWPEKAPGDLESTSARRSSPHSR